MENRIILRKYYITIVDLKTGTQQNLIRGEENITHTIEKFLDGWSNLRCASTSDRDIDTLNYQQCGTTKDGTKMYSILCCADNENNLK